MILDQHPVKETYYDILSVKENASYEEIRASYRSSILSCHPDKLVANSGFVPSDQSLGTKFMRVQKAWEILSNAKSRRAYDLELQASKLDGETAENICLEDMMAEDAEGILQLYYQCRCGDYFSVNSCELEQMGYKLFRDGDRISFQMPDTYLASLVLPCGSCSLRISILLKSDAVITANDL